MSSPEPEQGDARANPPLPRTVEELTAVVQRAEAGDRDVLPLVRRMLEKTPEIAIELFDGDPAQTLLNRLTRRLAGTRGVGRLEAIRKRVEQIRTGLLDERPTALERLIVDRIVCTWVQLQIADQDIEAPNADMSIELAEYRSKRQEQASRRHLSAIRALAAVRKLALPVLQLNVAQNQVNVGSAGAVEAASRNATAGGAAIADGKQEAHV